MASYRFSATVMKRSAGRSATAAAAYRAAETIECDRYGETHDYTRKQGVEHSEILTPDDAPEWMRDREKLWNAVEAIEKRKDAQLAREIQLSLPHELDAEQRRDLVRQFALEQFVSEGMIADLNLHAPHRDGDQRNYHAHIMLTMRELMGDGFGKKDRSWNDRANIQRWREEWAQFQNREFERLGLDVRVDHRSFEDQGVDREAQQHEGPAATGKRRRGEQSHVGDENDRRQAANENRAAQHHKELEAKIERQRERFEKWAGEKTAELEAAQHLTMLDHTRAAELKAGEMEDRIQGYYAENLTTVKAEISAIEQRMEAGWIKGAWRKITGRDGQDRKRLEAMQLTAHDAEQRMEEMRSKFQVQLDEQKTTFELRQEERRTEQQEGIERARERKEATLEGQRREWWEQQPQQEKGASVEWWEAQEPGQSQEQPDRSRVQDKNRDKGHEPER